MSAPLDAWLATGRLRRRLGRVLRPVPPRDELVRRHAPGRSFADVGCMWSVHGAIAFLAEEHGARAVTGLDVMAPTPPFTAEHERRRSAVRFVQGDVHDPETTSAVGVHDVVWCFGLLYHAPHPLLTLERLRSLTGELLVLGTETIPEVPGLEGACVFYPGLGGHSRARYAAVGQELRLGLSTPFAAREGYGNWWWGISRSALRGMLLATGFEVVAMGGDPFATRVLARPVEAARGGQAADAAAA